MSPKRTYCEDLNKLIRDLINVRRYREATDQNGTKFVFLFETDCATVWRWCPRDGFIYGGERPSA